MESNITLLTLLGVCAGSFTLLLWVYWALVFPIIQKQLLFRSQNNLDKFKLLGLEGDINPEGRLYSKIESFLSSSSAAFKHEGWVVRQRVPDSQIKDRSIRLKALIKEMDEQHPHIRHIVGDNLNALTSIYIAQRPFVVCVVIPLFTVSLFASSAKSWLNDKEVDFAASSLATS